MTFANPLRLAWSEHRPVRGAWCTSPSSVSAEAMASIGFDYVCVDLQHGAIDYSDAVPMFQAISCQGVTPLARVPSNDLGTIGKVLDAGALGVVVPLVSTPEDAAAAVAACRYPPAGGRSFGPVRAATTVGSRDIADLDQVVVAVMVETQEGLDRIDEIAATPGLDAIYVGPADLALALGLPPAYERPEPEHAEAIERIREACERHGVIPGIHCADGAMGARRLRQGFRMITVANDLVSMRTHASAELAAAGDPT